MKVHAEFILRDIENELHRRKGGGYFGDMRVGEWLEKIAINLIKNDTCNSVVTSPSLREYGPQVSYEEMVNILDDSFGCEGVRFDLAYNAGDSTWTIENFIVPASFYKAMEKVKEEKEEDKKLHREFSVGEMFTGLMLSKDYTVKLPYVEWLARAVQNLLNIKKEMPSDFSIHCTHGTKICFRDAIDDFVTHNEAGDRFIVVYSLSDECGEEGNSAIKFYDIRKVEEDN